MTKCYIQNNTVPLSSSSITSSSSFYLIGLGDMSSILITTAERSTAFYPVTGPVDAAFGWRNVSHSGTTNVLARYSSCLDGIALISQSMLYSSTIDLLRYS
jgi:hypothetical protein